MKLHQVVLPHGFHISFFFCISIFEKDPPGFLDSNPTCFFLYFSIFAEGQRTFGIFHLCSHSAQQSVAIPGFFCDNQKLMIWFILINHQWLSYLVASWIIRSTNRQNQHLLINDDYQDHTWLVFLCPPRSHCGRSHHLQTRKPWSITTLFHQIHIVDEKSGRWWRLTNNHINCNIFINLKLQWW